MYSPTRLIPANKRRNPGLEGLLPKGACLLAAAFLLMVTLPAPAQEDAGEQESVSEDQLAQIESAKTVDQLIGLGKRFVSQKQDAAAIQCIERICTLDPKQLTDGERQSPKSWNLVWFAHRSRLREKELATDDAAGRVELARWLHEAGVTGPARKLVAAALKIDGDLPQARQLAVELQPRLGLDFRYGLNHQVLLGEYQDDNVKIEPRRGGGFLLAPLYYAVAEKRYSFGATSARVETEAGKRCRVRGILLSKSDRSGPVGVKEGKERDERGEEKGHQKGHEKEGHEKPILGPPQQLPGTFDQVLYERIQVELKDGEPIVEWQNTTSSPPPRDSDGAKRSREAPSNRRGKMSASRWAALLIEYPQDTTKLKITLPNEEPETVDLALIRLVQVDEGGKRSNEPRPDGPTGRAREVSTYALDTSAAMAQLAVAWLTEALGGSGPGRADQGGEAVEVIEQALLAAMGHASGRVRQTAFKGLTESQGDQPLAEATREFIQKKLDADVLSAILAEIESSLRSARAVEDSDSSSPGRPGSDRGAAGTLRHTVTAPATPSATPKLFSLLSACLNCRHAEVRRQALGIALSEFKPPYEAPIRGSKQHGTEPEASGFEPLLARLAMDGTVNAESARAAATALVASGRLTALKDEFNQCSDSARRQDIVRALGEDKHLRTREALPIFLASCLSHDDPRTVQLALVLLAAIDKEVGSQDRWRVNLAVKQGLDADKKLVELTLHADKGVSEQAMNLLKRITMMTPEESREFESSPGEADRLGRLESMMRDRASQPVGEFACMVYVDLESSGATVGSRWAPGGSKPLRRNVPLVSSKVVIRQAGEGDFRVLAQNKEISMPGRSRRPRGGRRPGQAVLNINAAPLLGAALSSEDARREGLADKVDIPAMTRGNGQTCQLSPERLGTWAGDVMMPGGIGRPGTGRPMRVTVARIILEPLKP